MKKRPRPKRRKKRALPNPRKKRLMTMSAVLALVAAAALAEMWWLAGSDNRAADSTWVVIKRVRSGDSLLDEDGQKLRLLGVRAPLADEAYFEQAKEFTDEMTVGKTVEVRFDQVRRDKQNRIPGYLFVDEICVNHALVAEGLAYVRLTSTARRYADELLAAQSKARREKRGIWSQSNATHFGEYWADPKYGNFHGPDCVERGKGDPARIVTFASRDEALNQGFAPCSKCKP